MRTITVAEFISLDGVVESPERWHMRYVDAEMMAVMYPADSDLDTMLLGRTTYDSFAGAFAHAPQGDPVATRMNALTKAVVTSEPDTVTWANSTALTGDVVEAVRALKEQPGGSISVIGSITLARTLLAAGLVDEISLILHPLLVGAGTRLFPQDGPGATFTLATCTPLTSGVIHLVYTLTSGGKR
jgi:dihydrofolate reductase